VALFGRSENVTTLLRKIKDHEYHSTQELVSWLNRIDEEPDLKPKQVVWMIGHGHREVREFGKLRLIRMDDDDGIVELLLRELGGKPASIRMEIADLATAIDPGQVYKNLGRMLSSKQIDQRMGALDLIAVHPDWREYLGQLKAALKDPDTVVRQKVVEILCTDTRDRTIKLILKNLLFDESSTIRRLAITALAEHPDPDLVEPFLERLPLEPTREQALIVRALTRMARNPEAKLEDRLLPMLADESEQVREGAIRLLREIPNRTLVIRAYLQYSRGLAYWLRERSYKSFLRISRDILEPLMELMLDEDPEIKVGAMLLAADANDQRAVPGFRGVFKDQTQDWWVRVIAAESMARFPDRDVQNDLIREIDNPDLRHAIIAALGSIRNRESVHPLVQCLNDPQVSIRMAALDALTEFRFPDVADAVGHVAVNDGEEQVREKALLVLEELGATARPRLDSVRALLDIKNVADEEDNEFEMELEMENPRL
jgi:HEAT repeat protein